MDPPRFAIHHPRHEGGRIRHCISTASFCFVFSVFSFYFPPQALTSDDCAYRASRYAMHASVMRSLHADLRDDATARKSVSASRAFTLLTSQLRQDRGGATCYDRSNPL